MTPSRSVIATFGITLAVLVSVGLETTVNPFAVLCVSLLVASFMGCMAGMAVEGLRLEQRNADLERQAADRERELDSRRAAERKEKEKGE